MIQLIRLILFSLIILQPCLTCEAQLKWKDADCKFASFKIPDEFRKWGQVVEENQKLLSSGTIRSARVSQIAYAYGGPMSPDKGTGMIILLKFHSTDGKPLSVADGTAWTDRWVSGNGHLWLDYKGCRKGTLFNRSNGVRNGKLVMLNTRAYDFVRKDGEGFQVLSFSFTEPFTLNTDSVVNGVFESWKLK